MLKQIALNWLIAAVIVLSSFVAPAHAEPPNIVIVYCDDLGYADIGCFGASGYSTPHIDRLAKEGMRFTDFYVAQAVCSASRTALLTGCYPNRVGILGALNHQSTIGISDEEMTLAEVVKQQGYRTAIYGKWHLGYQPQFLPTRHGFDDYFGLPYSNDMWPQHPTAKFPPLPLIDDARTIGTNPDQTQLTTWYTERAVKFIEENKQRPFLLYVPHSMPHVPLFVSDKYSGKSERGLYGDVIQEIDWSVGEILAALDRAEITDHTLVIFTSDNGPWLSYGEHGGSATPLREGKGTSFEGGVRVPCVMRWPERVPAGSECDEPVMTIDILPTVAKIVGAALPPRVIDGRDIGALLRGTGKNSPHEALYFYWGQELQAIRSGPWKLHFPHDYRAAPDERATGGKPVPYASGKIELSLFNLEQDIGETKNVAEQNPQIVAKLQRLAESARAELGDSRTKRQGSGVRQPGRVTQPKS